VTSSFTWPATANAIIHAGATPVFADIDAGSLNLDPGAFAAAVTERTRAVIPVHIAGGPCDMDAIEAVAHEHGIVIVEDAAHAVETTVGDRKVGSIGDFTCFSLYATKSLAGGEGGIATMSDDAAAATMRLLRAQGITRDPWQRMQNRSLGHYDVVRPGYKANLADLQAAMALPKLDRIGELHARRTALVERYDAGIAGLAGIEPIARPPIGVHAHHLYIVNSTVVGNGSDVAGGGLKNAAGGANLFNVTIAGNTANTDRSGSDGVGGGVANAANATLAFANSIIANNSALVSNSMFTLLNDCTGTIESLDYNIVRVATCTVVGDYSTDAVQFGPLGYNGGPTQTLPLLAGSGGIDAGNPAGCTDNLDAVLDIDQRGLPRPVGAACDLGAYEVQPDLIFENGFDG